MRILLFFLLLAGPAGLFAQAATHYATPQPLDNPMSETYLQRQLITDRPPLLFREGEVEALRRKVATDPLLRQAADNLLHQAEALLGAAPLQRKMKGRRLLSVSREALRRTGLLGMAFLLGQEQRFADRLGAELTALSDFTNWNPKHFLDVAEMSLAVAIGLEWGGTALPKDVVANARAALHQKSLRPALSDKNWWVRRDNNWNQVCHGGTVAAAIVLADEYPKEAAQALHRALDGIPYGLSAYAPDGIYPEGPTYWSYGTGYTVVTIEMLRSAFGHDFGVAGAAGFLASASFRVACDAPSGLLYCFGDTNPRAIRSGSEFLAWFAVESGNDSLYDRTDIPREFPKDEKGSRAAALALTWLARLQDQPSARQLNTYYGRGPTPVFVLRDPNEPGFYLGAKGGYAAINHGNMDAGSFVLDLDSVRWSHDPGVQNYNSLEKRGFDLWNRKQDSDRWKLLSKNSENHSTLTVNDRQHRVNGFATLDSATANTATFDLTELFGGDVDDAKRNFRKVGPGQLVVEDIVQTNPTTSSLTWRLVTRADVSIQAGEALLAQNGKFARVRVLSPAGLRFSVVNLDPPPLPYDLRIPGLKRLELSVPEYLLEPTTSVTVEIVSIPSGE